MKRSATLCKALNKKFPLPSHPFNLNNKGIQSYPEWQFEKGEATIRFYLRHTDTTSMFGNKDVLDIGCGAAGKTIYYASHGVNRIVGLEILEKYKSQAEDLARKKGYADVFQFRQGDAAAMPFENNSFDTIIMNDAMEHVDEPEKVLQECHRVLKPGGKLFVNFPPYYHPHGAHLSDAIGIPWVHAFFSQETLVQVYQDAVKDLPDGEERIQFRIAEKPDGTRYFSYINGMTVGRFNKILPKTPFSVLYYHEEPLRPFLAPLAKLPGLKEFFVKMVVCILTK